MQKGIYYKMINDQQIESQDQKRTRNIFESEGKTAAVEEELVNSLTVYDQFKKSNATGITTEVSLRKIGVFDKFQGNESRTQIRAHEPEMVNTGTRITPITRCKNCSRENLTLPSLWEIYTLNKVLKIYFIEISILCNFAFTLHEFILHYIKSYSNFTYIATKKLENKKSCTIK